jgi:hypothetical protein
MPASPPTNVPQPRAARRPTTIFSHPVAPTKTADSHPVAPTKTADSRPVAPTKTADSRPVAPTKIAVFHPVAPTETADFHPVAPTKTADSRLIPTPRNPALRDAPPRSFPTPLRQQEIDEPSWITTAHLPLSGVRNPSLYVQTRPARRTSSPSFDQAALESWLWVMRQDQLPATVAGVFMRAWLPSSSTSCATTMTSTAAEA